MDKETLDKILRFRRSVAAVTKKGVKRRPIPFAEDRQSFGRLCGLGTPRLQNHGPMRRLKRSPPFLQRSRYRFHKPSIASASEPCDEKPTVLFQGNQICSGHRAAVRLHSQSIGRSEGTHSPSYAFTSCC